VVRRTYKVEGFRGLYRGFGVTAIGSAPAMAVYLTSYEKCKDALPEFHPIFARTPSFAHFVAGMLAETISCLLWVPIDVTKERLQVQELGGAHNYRGNIDAVRTIWRTEGLAGVYKGYLATILSFGPQSAFMFTFYEQMKRFSRSVLDVHADAEMPFAAHLFNSVVAGCGAALVTNPLDMVKLRLQVQRVSPGAFETPWGGRPYSGMIDGLVQIVRQEGFRALFKGAGARMAFSGPMTSISLATFESLRGFWTRALAEEGGDSPLDPGF